MKTERAYTAGPATVVALGLALTALYVFSVLFLMSRSDYNTWGALLLGPVLIAVTLPAFARQAAREGDRRLFWLLFFALLLKLAGSLARSYVAFGLYGGRADAQGYFGAGVRISDNFLSGNFDTGLRDLTGTDFINLLTGLIFTVTRPTLLGGFLVYSWLSFLGTFMFYRAFVIAVPEGRSRTYARLLFFIPSMIFWPASIGKEAWMIFAMGIAAYGIARILTGAAARGFVWAALGMWLAMIVRPHIALMLAIGLAVGYVFARPREEWGIIGPVAKATGLAVAAVLAGVLLFRTQEFLGGAGILSPSGVVSQLETVSERADSGGSEIYPTIVRSPAQLPIAVFTVLYRPFVTEAHNGQALIASLESLFLLILTLVRIRWIWAAVKSLRRQPYVAFAAVFVGAFVIAFASLPNLGLLTRERVQVLPMFFVLLSVAYRRKEEASDAVTSAAREPVRSRIGGSFEGGS
ncbi:MAG: hypothetical protein ACT4PO_13230 [Actinomycetota bacterium]